MSPRTIAHYQILEKLGEGGMGVVYKARDTRLDRIAALKVLPPDKTADEDRKRRFVLEAKAASALNHPNIITIYDINSDEGVDFIAMEYVAGKTLDRMVPRQGLRAAEALRIAVQVAHGLAAAHAANILHRDLKPGNVMVSDSGLVKVLDFGLAKLMEVSATGEETPTETIGAQTEEGTILGTVAYMSPEQAQGLKLDSRSDIFSFGAVLYEMLTGKRAFSGETRMSTIAAILTRDPEPLAEATPRELERIVQRCLRKDPARRFQTMADLKLALEDLKEDTDSGLSAVKPAPIRRRRWLAGAGIAVIVSIAAGGWWLWSARQPVIALGANLRQLTFDSGDSSNPALSPDAKLVAYHSDRAEPGKYDIWVQQVSGGPAIRLTKGPGNYWNPQFAADGSKLYFQGDTPQGIYEVSTLGGELRLIGRDGLFPSVSPDGRTVAYVKRPGGLSVVPTNGGDSRALAPDFDWERERPIWSLDGKTILLWSKKFGQPETSDYWAFPLDGGQPKPTGWVPWATAQGYTRGGINNFLKDGTAVGYLGRGDNARIIRLHYDPRTWKQGSFESLTIGTGDDDDPSVAAGMVAFYSGVTEGGVWSFPADTNQGKIAGPPIKLTTERASFFGAAVSADARRMVYIKSRAGSNDVYVHDLKTGEARPFTIENKGASSSPVISADGERILFSKYPFTSVYAGTPEGGTPQLICKECGPASSLSPDGKQLLSRRVERSRTPISLVDVDTAQSTVILRHSKFHLAQPNFSGDGKWIAFIIFHSPGVNDLAIAPFRGSTPVPEEEWIAVSSSPANFGRPFWSPDGALLYYLLTQGAQQYLMARRLDGQHRPVGDPIRVREFTGRIRPVAGTSFTALPDQIIAAMPEYTYNIWVMDLPR